MLKIASINILFFLLLVFIVELVAGRWFSDQYISNCFTEKYHHEYCKGWVGVNTLAEEDGGENIPVFVNKDGLRVMSEYGTSSDVTVSDFGIINIGDSFMQADEIEFSETLSSHISSMSDIKALQVGYSSWAPIQMSNWIKSHDIKRGSTVNLFTMVNDYIPSYRGANVNYHKEAFEGEDGLFHFKKHQGKVANLTRIALNWRQKSYFVSKYEQMVRSNKRSISVNKQFASFKPLDGASFYELSTDCSELSRWSEVPPLTFDYLSFSFDSKCWSKVQLEAVESALKDINKIHQYLKARGVKLNVLVIPPGWSFVAENLAGKASVAYKIAPNTTITIEGLTAYVSQNTAANVIDLEPVIAKFKRETNNSLYFNLDGHWTKYMHKKLAIWMAKDVLSIK